MPTYTLTDVVHDLWVESFAISAADLEATPPYPWSITKRALRGGRRDGVDLIQVNNGTLAFSIVPTRGMGIWKGENLGDRLGWDSPVGDGPINPAFVNLMHWGGLGWIEGFDELLARCGLENNGAPYELKTVHPDGTESHVTYGLHGKIANIPASFVAVHVETEPEEVLAIEGHVDESKPFAPQIRMISRIATKPGSNRLVVRDEFVNRKDTPVAMQVLYHWNFGSPFLEEGARFLAPVKTVVPRDPRAREGLGRYDVYGPPEPGFAEQVYFFDLHAEPETNQSLAMLRNRAGDKAVVMRFDKAQLPYFTLWKNTGGRNEGYVTGLEPGTNYPNKKPFEEARGRVVTLAPGGRFVAEIVLEVLNDKDGVARIEAEIEQLQASGPPTVLPEPAEPYAPVSS